MPYAIAGIPDGGFLAGHISGQEHPLARILINVLFPAPGPDLPGAGTGPGKAVPAVR